jgi:predicted nucleotidyltransferase
LLNAHDVQYLVIGEYAVNFHGYPRYTKNIDFWLWMTDENIEKLLQVIKSFGFGSLGLDKNDFSDADNIIQLGYEPYRIDLLTDVNGVDFQECYNRRIDGEIETVKVKFLSIDDLIVAKKNAGRLQDLADAEQLEKLRNKK